MRDCLQNVFHKLNAIDKLLCEADKILMMHFSFLSASDLLIINAKILLLIVIAKESKKLLVF